MISQTNWEFIGSNMSLAGETGINVPRSLTSPQRNSFFKYYDLLMVRWYINMASGNDMLYLAHGFNILGSNWHSRIFRYIANSTTPSQTNSLNSGFCPLFQSATSGGWAGEIYINNRPHKLTGERMFAGITYSVNNAGSPPQIQMISGSTVYTTPFLNVSINTQAATALATGSIMTVYGANLR